LAPEAFGVLLRGCGDVEQDDYGEDQQDTDPSESASHDSNFDWFLSTGERRSALKTRPIWHTIRKVATLASERTQSVRSGKSVDLRLQHPPAKERKTFTG
jgi:hypothetical protein